MTRLYFNQNQAMLPLYAPQAADFDARLTGDASMCYQMSTSRVGSSWHWSTSIADVLGTTMKGHLFSAMTPPLVACTISGTIKGQLEVLESDTAADMMAYLVVRLLHPDLSHKGYFYNAVPGSLASEFPPSSYVNRQFPYGGSQTITTQVAAAGDRIVADYGYVAFNAVATSYTAQYALLDVSSSSDLPEDETDGNYSTKNPWLEFSTGLVFTPPFAIPKAQEGEGLKFLPTYQVQEAMSGKLQGPRTGQLWPRP